MQSTPASDSNKLKCKGCAHWVYSGDVYSHELMKYTPSGICVRNVPLESRAAEADACVKYTPRDRLVGDE